MAWIAKKKCFRFNDSRSSHIAAGNPDVLADAGASLGALGRWDEAIAALQRALTLSPSHLLALLSLGKPRFAAHGEASH